VGLLSENEKSGLPPEASRADALAGEEAGFCGAGATLNLGFCFPNPLVAGNALAADFAGGCFLADEPKAGTRSALVEPASTLLSSRLDSDSGRNEASVLEISWSATSPVWLLSANTGGMLGGEF
jgi:hypothetical protein